MKDVDGYRFCNALNALGKTLADIGNINATWTKITNEQPPDEWEGFLLDDTGNVVYGEYEREDGPDDDDDVVAWLKIGPSDAAPPVEVTEDNGHRKAQIEALQWVNRWSTGMSGPVLGCACELCKAITRLENGGNLVE